MQKTRLALALTSFVLNIWAKQKEDNKKTVKL